MDLARDLEAEAVRPGLGDADALEGVDRRRRAGEPDQDRLRGQVAKLIEGALVDEASLTQDPDSVAERLDFPALGQA